MNNNLVAYYESNEEYATSFLSLLNPTGRWKLVDTEYSKNKLFIEHKIFWIFSKWIHENDIHFYNKKQEIIFDCKDKI